MSDEPKTDGEDELKDESTESGTGAGGGLPDEGIEGDEDRGGEGDAGPASGSSGPGSGG
jgi:hypothetical protein